MGDGCKHLNNFKVTKGIKPYKTIFSYFIACSSEEARNIKVNQCYCYSCKKKETRLHSCFHCIYFGCYSGGHIQEHAKTKKHFLAVELAFGNILCFQCGDYVYDCELSTVASELRQLSAASVGMSCIYESWRPSLQEVKMLQANKRVRTIVKDSTLGLRGLLNLGSTCFMNCVVQALTHTPLLRDYFLSDRHMCQLQEPPGQCLVCIMSSLFQEFYSGRKSPLILDRLVHIVWINASHLAGYRQQDAHEFFITILDLMHRHCMSSTSNPQHCTCIIDQIFTGSLQSDITCSVCSGVSTTVDSFRDISLDLGCSVGRSLSLLECLQQFTSPEPLSEKEKVRCNNCNTNQLSTKQLTMRTLPIVICFHLKRFENTNQLHKISTEVAFPQELDMSPFMSHKRNSNGQTKNYSSNLLEEYRYSLFGVVNHIGSMETGHYTAFIRQQYQHWYNCDDVEITRADMHQVLDSEGYLLFYHKKILEYV